MALIYKNQCVSTVINIIIRPATCSWGFLTLAASSVNQQGPLLSTWACAALLTTMPANTGLCPCDKLQIMQSGFNNLPTNRTHTPLRKAPWSQRARLIIQRRGSDSATGPAQGDLSLTPTTCTRPTPIQPVQVSCSVDQISWDRAPPQPAN